MTKRESDEENLILLPNEVEFLKKLEVLKDTMRHNPVIQGDRRERVGEHCWSIAVATILLSDESPESIDVGHATMLAVAHDIAEAYAGDTFAFDSAEVQTQAEREAAAISRMRSDFPAAGCQRLIDLWQEYEDQATPEARFVKGMDAFHPILLNFSNLDQSSWKADKVLADQVRRRLGRVANYIGRLASINERMIGAAQALKYLR